MRIYYDQLCEHNAHSNYCQKKTKSFYHSSLLSKQSSFRNKCQIANLCKLSIIVNPVFSCRVVPPFWTCFLCQWNIYSIFLLRGTPICSTDSPGRGTSVAQNGLFVPQRDRSGVPLRSDRGNVKMSGENLSGTPLRSGKHQIERRV